jgi:hypothetical protein
MVGVAGAAFTVTVVPALAALWQPEHLSLERYMFPKWLLKSIGLSLVDHKYELPALDVNVTLPPAQRLLIRLLLWIVAGAAFTVTVVPELAALWQPEAFVTQTVYVPDVLKSIGLSPWTINDYPHLTLTVHTSTYWVVDPLGLWLRCCGCCVYCNCRSCTCSTLAT